MPLSKKHFNRVAATIAEAEPAQGMPDEWARGCNAGREYIARHLADFFASENPNFDRNRFLQACEVTT